ncbi:NrdH-redoxin [Candidatus Saccharibacteria bacterium]|nr:MAG: NrdH-redoxin [Candidatus Saccharibacteria bacterium]
MSEDTTNNHQEEKVIVYSTSWCAFCHTEIDWLKKLGVEFVVKDIEAEPTSREELLSKNGGNFQGVPVTDINGELILGFDRPKLEEALKKNKLVTNS